MTEGNYGVWNAAQNRLSISKDLELQSNNRLCNAFLEVAVLQMLMRKLKVIQNC